MSQQRRDLGFAASEGLKDLHRVTTTAECQNRVAESLTRYLDGFSVIEPNLFKGGKCIGAEDFCPFVAVITCRVASAENMLE